MWALFTRALTAAPSTTKVSITNTSANFLVTAILGMIVFGERVRGLWWLGAGMMGAGCILVGMREEKGKENKTTTNNNGSLEGEEDETITLRSDVDGNVDGVGDANGESAYHDEEEEDNTLRQEAR
jgi:hypothetical protein